jgi:hypothetical protein
MNWRYPISVVSGLKLTLFVMLLGVMPSAHGAADQISVENLQAAVRTLNFLESLPKEGIIVVGVVYPAEVPTAKSLAANTAKVITTLTGPNSRTLQPIILSTTDLAQFNGHLNVIFLVAGSSKHPELVLGALRRLHLVSISDDPACVDTNCCVLMIRTVGRVEITLDTALADAVGARYSLVFTMVVKRK